MSKPTAEIRKRHDKAVAHHKKLCEGVPNKINHGTPAHIDRGILLDRLEEAEETIELWRRQHGQDKQTIKQVRELAVSRNKKYPIGGNECEAKRIAIALLKIIGDKDDKQESNVE